MRFNWRWHLEVLGHMLELEGPTWEWRSWQGRSSDLHRAGTEAWGGGAHSKPDACFSNPARAGGAKGQWISGVLIVLGIRVSQQ